MRRKRYRRQLPRQRGQRAFAMTTLLGAVAILAVLNWPVADATEPVSSPPSALSSASTVTGFLCYVAHVNDGDTLRFKDGARVRLHAVAAREADETCSPGHPCPFASGASATALLNRLGRRRRRPRPRRRAKRIDLTAGDKAARRRPNKMPSGD